MHTAIWFYGFLLTQQIREDYSLRFSHIDMPGIINHSVLMAEARGSVARLFSFSGPKYHIWRKF